MKSKQKIARRSIVTSAFVLTGLIALTVPFLCVVTPPLTDYPNHLARYWLIAGGARDPVLAAFYRVDWTNAVTNVGVDRCVAALANLASGLTLGRAALVLSALLPPLGILALNLAVFRRVSPWQVIFPLAAWSTTFLMGFVNFQIGLGLALLFASIDPIVQPRLGSWAKWIRVPLGLILAIDHLFALIFYAVLLAGLGMGEGDVVSATWPARLRRLASATGAAAWCLVPLAAVWLSSKALPGAQPPASPPIGSNWGRMILGALTDKLATLLSPLASYNVLQEVVIVAALAILFVALVRRRTLVAHGGLLIAFAGLALLALFAPGRAMGASWVDRRFPIMALCCLMAALRMRENISIRTSLTTSVTALGIVVAQTAWVAWNWESMAGETRAVREATASVPAGATILPLQHRPFLAVRMQAPAGRYMFLAGDPTFRHFDALAVPTRHVFVPNLFSARGLQPLRVVGAWDHLVEHNGGDLASVAVLSRASVPGDPSYISGWRKHFDYVLILNADMPDQSGPFVPPPELKLVADRGFAQLWRVVGSGR